MERKKVDQYSMDGAFIATHNSIASAAKALHRDPKAIKLACEGITRICGGFVLRYHGVSFDRPLTSPFFNEEEWTDVKGYEGFYKVSIYGEIRAVERIVKHGHSHLITRRGLVLKPCQRTDGYLIVGLTKDNKRENVAIHRMVALAFIPNPENKPCIDHIDGNKHNNHKENLRWCTQKENSGFPIARARKSLGNLKRGGSRIAQYDKNGNFISQYTSIREAAEKTGLSYGAIFNSIHNKVCSLKYDWKCIKPFRK